MVVRTKFVKDNLLQEVREEASVRERQQEEVPASCSSAAEKPDLTYVSNDRGFGEAGSKDILSMIMSPGDHCPKPVLCLSRRYTAPSNSIDSAFLPNLRRTYTSFFMVHTVSGC